VARLQGLFQEVFPGVYALVGVTPSDTDKIGCDGLYVQAVIVTDPARFENFCHWRGVMPFSFSVN